MNIWLVLGAVFLLEGVMPLLFTQAWRETFKKLLALRDGQIRFVGFLAVLIGVALIITHMP